MSGDKSGRVVIATESDIVVTRQTVRDITENIGFGITDITRIVTAASELARNIYIYAGSGYMDWCISDSSDRIGIELQFIDHGPGISDIGEVMQVGFTSSKGLGLGLPGSKKLMDEFELVSKPGQGTTVTVKKWMRL